MSDDATLKIHGDEVDPGPAPAPEVSPSEALIKNALKPARLPYTDAEGKKHVLGVRKPGILAQFQLVDAVGPETAANQTYMSMIMPLIYLGDIDGEPVYPPSSKLEVEALIQRLDEEGLAELISWWMVNVRGPIQNAMDAAAKVEREKNQVKN